jgi:hypothetical protein
LNIDEGVAELLVAIREANAATRWQVQVAAETIAHTATTDERGVARFPGLPIASLWQITLDCSVISNYLSFAQSSGCVQP